MRSLLIPDLHKDYRAGVKPADVIREVYAAIDAAADPGIFISMVSRDDALAAADALGAFDPAKPLWGVPFAVKDNIDVAGMETTAACPDFAFLAKETAPAVARLVDAGAILIGKTNLDQFATGLVGVRSPYPIPRNAIDPALVPGGSSSGSAVAVARGLVTFALGTDTAGSGRVPAALNNIVGLKPSLGLFSTRGMLPACRTLDCISVFAMTTADAWQAASVMAVYDDKDPYSRAIPIGAPALPPKLRVGVPVEGSLEFCGDGASATAFGEATRRLEAFGCTMVPFDLTPFRKVAELLYGGPWVAERYQAIREVIENRPGILHPVTRQIIGGATKLSAADAFAGLYDLAELKRSTLGSWKSMDAMIVPSIPTLYTLADLAADPIGPNSRLGTYTNFVNLLDLCALAVPSGTRSDGRPAGVTFIGPAGTDALLAAIGSRMHAAAGTRRGATGLALPPLPSASVSAPPGYIEIVAVGAHMSGLPLNHELTSLGGVFIRSTRTSPSYALYALPGGPPKRPGLMRIADGQGASIEVEVWALPVGGFGTFVASIPAPLVIGTLRLSDGTSPKGFLVEAEAVKEARDISAFGGWRGFLAAS